MEVFEATIENDVIIYNDPTRDVYCYVFNRDKFDSFKEVLRGEGQGVYILHSEKTGELYIGEGQFKNRISSHLETKDFWTRALVFNSTVPGKFHKSYLEYFEASFIKKAVLNDIQTTNGQGGKKGLADAKSKAYFKVMEEMIKVSTMSDIFKSKDYNELIVDTDINKDTVPDKQQFDGIYHHSKRKSGIEGNLRIKEGKYFLLKGAICANYYKSYIGDGYKKVKDLYIEDNGGETFILQEDLEFTSASAAAVFLTGVSINGYDFWINEDNRSINKEIDYRKNIS